MSGLSSKVTTSGLKWLVCQQKRPLVCCSVVIVQGPRQHRWQSTAKPASTAAKRPNAKTESRSSGPFPASREESANLADEKFYKYYLRDMPNKPSKLDPAGAWLGLAEFDAGKSTLPIHLHERPLDFFGPLDAVTPGLRDLYTAQLCLERHIAKTSVNRSKEDVRKQFASPDHLPGTKAFSWLRQDYDGADLSDNAGFIRALVHCLIAEGAEDQVWQWLEIKRLPSVLSHQDRDEQFAWRGALLRFLVESKVFWNDAEGINPALRSFERSWLLPEIGAPFINRTSAGSWIERRLVQGGASSTADVRLFDQFVGRLAIHKKDVVHASYRTAQLLRVHPKKACGLPGFRWLEENIAATPRPAFLRELLMHWSGFRFIFNTARHLERQGYQREARWMLDVGREEMPDFFAMRPNRSAATKGVLGYEGRHPGKQKPAYSEREQRRRGLLRG